MPSLNRKVLALCLAVSPVIPSLAHGATTDSEVRNAAQKGLTFLGNNTLNWQKSNRCYGCHVQAVTLEGLSVGKQHQYDVSSAAMKGVLEGILDFPGGAHQSTKGLWHDGYPKTARTFGASAFARYDAFVDGKLTDDLLKVARQITEYQQKDGSVVGDHVGMPVTTGPMQATFQAMQAWRQAFARTADDAWLAPLRRAETWVASTARGWEGKPEGVYLQDVNYAVMGLVAAGAGRGEADVMKLSRFLLSKQNKDGGWGFNAGTSDPYATGQTVHALKNAGYTEQDVAVSKGLNWLVAHQAKDGGWGAAGSARAEAMWAVMGLVSVDVLTVAVDGVVDGSHVAAVHNLVLKAEDNQGTKVKNVELFIDDLPVKKVEGGTLSFEWKTDGLKTGKHTIDAVAENAKGSKSRRRLEVFAGDTFVTQVGTRFEDNVTQVTFRQLADEKATISLEIAPDGGKPVFTSSQPATKGPMAFVWNGKDAKGTAQKSGRYTATLKFVDAKGAVRQTESTVFVNASIEEQRQKFAEIEGSIGLGRADEKAANADIELVDESGRVVQSVRSNDQGNYRFKSVDQGKYKVRFKKDGFGPAKEMPVQAAPAAVSKASGSF